MLGKLTLKILKNRIIKGCLDLRYNRVLSLPSRLTLCSAMDITLRAPLSVGFSRQEHVSGLPWLPPGGLSGPGSEPESHISCIGRQVLYYYFLRNLLNPCGSGPRREKPINEIMKTIECIWCLICYTVLYFILYCLISFYIKRKWFIYSFGKPR